MKALRITHWNAAHETYESKKLTFMAWVPIPNKHDGLGFGFLKEQDNRVELYCAFALMVQIASKAPKGQRGWLVRSGKRLEPRDMARMTGFPEGIFTSGTEFFQQPEIGWLTEDDFPETPSDTPAPRTEKPEESAGTTAGRAGKAEGSAEKSPTDRQGEKTEKTGRETRAREPFTSPSLDEFRELVGGLRLERDVPDDYLAFFWRKKNERSAGWFDKKGALLPAPDLRQQLENWWLEDESKWANKNAAPAQKLATDSPTWWTDPLSDLETAARGAALYGDPEKAQRILAILAFRKVGG